MLNTGNILSYLLILPILGAFILFLIPKWNFQLLRITALFFSFSTFILSLFLWVWFDKSISQFQYVDQLFWVPSLNLNFTVGLDGISLFLIILTTLLIPLCILASWVGIKNNVKEYLIAFLIMESFLIGVFCSVNIIGCLVGVFGELGVSSKDNFLAGKSSLSGDSTIFVLTGIFCSINIIG